MSAEMVTISKDEYIALLRCKAELMAHELAQAASPRPFLPRNQPHSWLAADEVAEIMRLHAEGLRSGEIGRRVGRPMSTVRRCIVRRLGGAQS